MSYLQRGCTVLDYILNLISPYKVALQYSGFPRSFDTDYLNHYNSIIKRFKPDIYMHLWKDNKNDLKPEKMVEMYKPKEYIIEERVGHNTDTIASRIKSSNLIHPDTDAFAGVSMLYSRYKANQLRQKSHIIYDVVISLRTELFFEQPLTRSYLEQAKQGSMIIPSEYNHAGINDLFCIANMQGADIFNSVYEHINRLIFDNYTRFNQHSIMLDRLKETNINILRPQYRIKLRGRKTYEYT